MTENDAQQERTRTLGLARWVQGTFMVAALFLFWLFDKVILLAWNTFATPSSTLSSVAAAVLAGVSVMALYRNPKVNAVTNEVVGELAKVTWPSRKETTASAVVVVITSIIAAAILGSFDTVWSAITDLIYKA